MDGDRATVAATQFGKYSHTYDLGTGWKGYGRMPRSSFRLRFAREALASTSQCAHGNRCGKMHRSVSLWDTVGYWGRGTVWEDTVWQGGGVAGRDGASSRDESAGEGSM